MVTPVGDYQHPQEVLDLMAGADIHCTLEEAYEYEIDLRLANVAEFLQNVVDGQSVRLMPRKMLIHLAAILLNIQGAVGCWESSQWSELGDYFRRVDRAIKSLEGMFKPVV